MDDTRTTLTLDEALRDPLVVRKVGAPVLRLAQAVLDTIPRCVAPMVVTTAPWPDDAARPDDEPMQVLVWYHPHFSALLTDMSDKEPEHAAVRETLAPLSISDLRARYWEHIDPAERLARRGRIDERAELEARETEKRLILAELSRRGVGLTQEGEG